MPDFVASARAASNGTATVEIQQTKSGLVWVVSQMAVESQPVRNTAKCTVKRNGQLMTTTAIVPATAGGNPFYRLNAGDILSFFFENLTSGDTARAIISYEESQWGQANTGAVV